MAYGTVKVDNITFTNGGIDQTITVSGIVQSISGNITATGTIQAATIIGTSTVSGATVTGNAGVFTTVTGGSAGFTTVTGTTVTGTTANFATLSGTTITGSVGNFGSGSAAAPSVSVGTTDNGIYSPGADQVAISTNGTGRLFVDSSGRVGVGTTSPNEVLETVGTIRSTRTGSTGYYFKGYRSSTTSSFYIYDDGTNIQLTNEQAGALQFRTQNTERARIDSSGRLGIGTSSPNSELHVIGDLPGGQFLVASNETDSTLKYGSLATTHYTNAEEPFLGVGLLSNSANNVVYIGGALSEFNAATFIQFNTAANNTTTSGSERARIDSSGRLLVGTSSAFGGTPTGGNLQIQSSSQFGPQLGLRGLHDGSNPVFAIFERARGSNIVQSGDSIFQLDCRGFDGTNYLTAARIVAQVDGTPGANDMPGRLVFSTTADGASSPTERMRIDSSGRVGIGTASPTTLLHVLGDAQFGTADANAVGVELGNGATGNRSVRIDFVGDTTYTDYGLRVIRASGGANGNSQINHRGTGSLILNAEDAGSITLNANGSERARIDSSGRLLVGTSSEAGNAILNVRGNTGSSTGVGVLNVGLGTTRPTAADAGIGYIRFTSTSNSSSNYHYASINCETDGASSSDTDIPGRLVFSTTADGASSPTEAMRINSAGDVCIGVAFSTPGSANTNTGVGLTKAGSLFASRSAAVTANFNRNTSDGDIALFRREGNSVGSISVTTTATAYNTSSDYRLKENVTAVTDGITRLQQLKPSRFNFIADPAKTVDGFIAHEVQTIVPEAISGEKDAVDDEGNPEYQGIDQSKLVPLLTAALQELVAEVESLKAEVAALKAQ